MKIPGLKIKGEFATLKDHGRWEIEWDAASVRTGRRDINVREIGNESRFVCIGSCGYTECPTYEQFCTCIGIITLLDDVASEAESQGASDGIREYSELNE